MSWFNASSDDEGLTRRVVTEVDLGATPLTEWTMGELGYRLAVIYPQVDGDKHLTASAEVKAEVEMIRDEVTRRGYDWTSNLRFNEKCTGWGWLPGFQKLEED